MAKRIADFRQLALRQRSLIRLLLLAILLQLFTTAASPIFPVGVFEIYAFVLFVVELLVHVLMLVGVVRILLAGRHSIVMVVICGIFMLAPCVNLLVLILVNMSATHQLRRVGIRVGFLGVDREELERVLNTDLCTRCGYNLTGNVTGICPECGGAIDRATPPVPVANPVQGA